MPGKCVFNKLWLHHDEYKDWIATDEDPHTILYNDKSKVYLGFAAEQMIKEKLKKKVIKEKDVFSLRKDGQQNIIAMIEHFMLKCPINYLLVKNANCIDPRVMAGQPEIAQEKMKKVLIVLLQNKRILEKDCDEILLVFADFLSKVVIPNSSTFASFDPKKDSLDCFLQTYFISNNYEKVWKVVKMILILSHGQASVERGFSVNKALEVENLKESSYISQRIIHEFIQQSGSIHDIHVTKEMRMAAISARSKYTQYLETQKSSVKTVEIQQKRKAVEDEINYLKKKKIFLENDITKTNKKANALADEAEISKNIDLFIQSHELRKNVSAKETEIRTLDLKLSEKCCELKSI